MRCGECLRINWGNGCVGFVIEYFYMWMLIILCYKVWGMKIYICVKVVYWNNIVVNGFDWWM